MALSIYHVNTEVYTIMKVFENVTITSPTVRAHKVEWNSKVQASLLTRRLHTYHELHVGRCMSTAVSA